MFEEVRQASEANKGQVVNALCQMTGISRASYYRWRVPPPRIPVEMELRDAIQQIALEFPAYGYLCSAKCHPTRFRLQTKKSLCDLR